MIQCMGNLSPVGKVTQKLMDVYGWIDGLKGFVSCISALEKAMRTRIIKVSKCKINVYHLIHQPWVAETCLRHCPIACFIPIGWLCVQYV